MRFREFAIAGLPAYDADLDETFDAGPYPAAVRDLRHAVTEADAMLIVSPEYNWGPPGFSKNALDWLSRPAGHSPLHRKPIALMGASPGPAGTMRGQLQLRQNLTAVRSYPLPEPDVYLGRAAGLFDDSLGLVDERSQTLVRAQLEALIEWTMRHEVPDAEAEVGVSE
jgi:chromate reductase